MRDIIVAMPVPFLPTFLEFLEENTNLVWLSGNKPTGYIPNIYKKYIRLHVRLGTCISYEDSHCSHIGDVSPNEYIAHILYKKNRR